MKAQTSTSMTGTSTPKRTSKAQVGIINNLGKLWQKGKGLYTGEFSNGNKHGKG